MTTNNTDALSAPNLAKAQRPRKAIIAGSIGHAVEFVDWTLYAVFAKVLAEVFFPETEGLVGLLATLSVFAVGFVIRPLGAAILGPYADRHGRKKGLALTIGLMTGAGFAIAFIPGYEQIGYAAPILLLILRLVQGFSVGGEVGASSTFLVESAAPGRRAFAGSWQQVAAACGVLLASGLGTAFTSILSRDELHSWGWRVAFIIGSVLGVVGIWLRISVEDTSSLAAAKSNKATRRPFIDTFRQHPKAALRVVGITLAGTLTYYIWVNYLPTYANITTGIPLNQALLSQTICLVVFLVCIPLIGILSDRIGRKPTMAAFALGFVLLSWPLLHFLNGEFWNLLIIQLIGMLMTLGYAANCAVIMAEQFPPEVRATGIAVPYALTVAIFGGTAPYVTTWLSSEGLAEYLWIYVSAAALISLVVYLRMPETKDKEFV